MRAALPRTPTRWRGTWRRRSSACRARRAAQWAAFEQVLEFFACDGRGRLCDGAPSSRARCSSIGWTSYTVDEAIEVFRLHPLYANAYIQPSAVRPLLLGMARRRGPTTPARRRLAALRWGGIVAYVTAHLLLEHGRRRRHRALLRNFWPARATSRWPTRSGCCWWRLHPPADLQSTDPASTRCVRRCAHFRVFPVRARGSSTSRGRSACTPLVQRARRRGVRDRPLRDAGSTTCRGRCCSVGRNVGCV